MVDLLQRLTTFAPRIVGPSGCLQTAVWLARRLGQPTRRGRPHAPHPGPPPLDLPTKSSVSSRYPAPLAALITGVPSEWAILALAGLGVATVAVGLSESFPTSAPLFPAGTSLWDRVVRRGEYVCWSLATHPASGWVGQAWSLHLAGGWAYYRYPGTLVHLPYEYSVAPLYPAGTGWLRRWWVRSGRRQAAPYAGWFGAAAAWLEAGAPGGAGPARVVGWLAQWWWAPPGEVRLGRSTPPPPTPLPGPTLEDPGRWTTLEPAFVHPEVEPFQEPGLDQFDNQHDEASEEEDDLTNQEDLWVGAPEGVVWDGWDYPSDDGFPLFRGSLDPHYREWMWTDPKRPDPKLAVLVPNDRDAATELGEPQWDRYHLVEPGDGPMTPDPVEISPVSPTLWLEAELVDWYLLTHRDRAISDAPIDHPTEMSHLLVETPRSAPTGPGRPDRMWRRRRGLWAWIWKARRPEDYWSEPSNPPQAWPGWGGWSPPELRAFSDRVDLLESVPAGSPGGSWSRWRRAWSRYRRARGRKGHPYRTARIRTHRRVVRKWPRRPRYRRARPVGGARWGTLRWWGGSTRPDGVTPQTGVAWVLAGVGCAFIWGPPWEAWLELTAGVGNAPWSRDWLGWVDPPAGWSGYYRVRPTPLAPAWGGQWAGIDATLGGWWYHADHYAPRWNQLFAYHDFIEWYHLGHHGALIEHGPLARYFWQGGRTVPPFHSSWVWWYGNTTPTGGRRGLDWHLTHPPWEMRRVLPSRTTQECLRRAHFEFLREDPGWYSWGQLDQHLAKSGRAHWLAQWAGGHQREPGLAAGFNLPVWVDPRGLLGGVGSTDPWGRIAPAQAPRWARLWEGVVLDGAGGHDRLMKRWGEPVGWSLYEVGYPRRPLTRSHGFGLDLGASEWEGWYNSGWADRAASNAVEAYRTRRANLPWPVPLGGVSLPEWGRWWWWLVAYGAARSRPTWLTHLGVGSASVEYAPHPGGGARSPRTEPRAVPGGPHLGRAGGAAQVGHHRWTVEAITERERWYNKDRWAPGLLWRPGWSRTTPAGVALHYWRESHASYIPSPYGLDYPARGEAGEGWLRGRRRRRRVLRRSGRAVERCLKKNRWVWLPGWRGGLTVGWWSNWRARRSSRWIRPEGRPDPTGAVTLRGGAPLKGLGRPGRPARTSVAAALAWGARRWAHRRAPHPGRWFKTPVRTPGWSLRLAPAPALVREHTGWGWDHHRTATIWVEDNRSTDWESQAQPEYMCPHVGADSERPGEAPAWGRVQGAPAGPSGLAPGLSPNGWARTYRNGQRTGYALTGVGGLPYLGCSGGLGGPGYVTELFDEDVDDEEMYGIQHHDEEEEIYPPMECVVEGPHHLSYLDHPGPGVVHSAGVARRVAWYTRAGSAPLGVYRWSAPATYLGLPEWAGAARWSPFGGDHPGAAPVGRVATARALRRSTRARVGADDAWDPDHAGRPWRWGRAGPTRPVSGGPVGWPTRRPEWADWLVGPPDWVGYAARWGAVGVANEGADPDFNGDDAETLDLAEGAGYPTGYTPTGVVGYLDGWYRSAGPGRHLPWPEAAPVESLVGDLVATPEAAQVESAWLDLLGSTRAEPVHSVHNWIDRYMGWEYPVRELDHPDDLADAGDELWPDPVGAEAPEWLLAAAVGGVDPGGRSARGRADRAWGGNAGWAVPREWGWRLRQRTRRPTRATLELRRWGLRRPDRDGWPRSKPGWWRRRWPLPPGGRSVRLGDELRGADRPPRPRRTTLEWSPPGETQLGYSHLDRSAHLRVWALTEAWGGLSGGRRLDW